MPRRTDISTILVIGSGPIVIGQACEFDYSGTQACRVLRAEGYRVVLANSNPATIMTDPEFADATYVEPLDATVLERIIALVQRAHERERLVVVVLAHDHADRVATLLPGDRVPIRSRVRDHHQERLAPPFEAALQGLDHQRVGMLVHLVA